jgi:hypothetical protein
VRRYLVIANQTLSGGHLRVLLRDLAEPGASFFLLVPATPPTDHPWTDEEAWANAKRRLTEAVDNFGAAGIHIDRGEVGDAHPVMAVQDLLNRGEEFDEIVLSTLPPGPSKWLKLDLPHRLEVSFGLPVRVVTGSAESVTS